MQDHIRYYILLVITAASFLLIGRCTSEDHVNQDHIRKAKDIHLSEGEVLIDLASIDNHVVVFHEDPLCSRSYGKRLAKVPYDTFSNVRLAPCAFCCSRYKFK